MFLHFVVAAATVGAAKAKRVRLPACEQCDARVANLIHHRGSRYCQVCFEYRAKHDNGKAVKVGARDGQWTVADQAKLSKFNANMKVAEHKIAIETGFISMAPAYNDCDTHGYGPQ